MPIYTLKINVVGYLIGDVYKAFMHAVPSPVSVSPS